MPKSISLLFIFVFFFPTALLAETKEAGVPFSITSEKMTVKGLEDKVLFEGAVVIQRGDMAITAGNAEVLLSNKDKDTFQKNVHSEKLSGFSSDAGKEIVRIALTKKVTVQQGNRRVVAEEGIYHAKEGEIVLTGNAQMWEEGYHVKGRVIRFSLVKKRSFVEGSQLTIYE
ncbi:MAG: LptA/OstA family protein [Nitrospirota bacterium]